MRTQDGTFDRDNITGFHIANIFKLASIFVTAGEIKEEIPDIQNPDLLKGLCAFGTDPLDISKVR